MKPTKQVIKKVKEYANFKLSITNTEADKLKEAFNDLILKHSDLRYIQLESIFEIEEKENKAKEIINIKEKKPHTSVLLNINENSSKESNWLIRATTSNKVQIKNSEPMKTHTPSTGIINENKIEKKTNIIGVKKEDVKIIFNEKLAKNLERNPNYKNLYNQSLINSLENPFYFWDKGDLKKDVKYKSLIEKIEKDENLKENKEIKKCLDNIIDIYQKNIKNFKNTVNNEVFNAVIKTVLSEDNNIDLTTLTILLQIIEKK